MLKKVILYFLFVFLVSNSGLVFAQVALKAGVIEVSGEMITIDSGKNNGLVEGLKGKSYYIESLNSRDIQIDVAFVEIVSVDNSTSILKILRKTDEIKGGYTVELTAGTISIDGIPAKANIYLDNEQIGKAPISNRLITFGSHRVRIQMSEYDDKLENITADESSPVEISYNLVPQFSLFSIEGRPPGANVYVDGKEIGRTPVSKMKISPGNHKLKIIRMGYEVYEETFTTQKAKTTELAPILIPKTKLKAFKKSLIFPGSGQRYTEHKGKGVLITVLQIATIGGAVGATVKSMEVQSEYDDAITDYKNAGSLYEIDRTAKFAEDKYDEASGASTAQMAAIGAAAAVYLWNIIDVAINSPKVEVRPPGNAINIQPRIEKDYSGIFLSMRF
ncbi:PEGA domain-containing protein [Candidatus Latescibacterota bacterium]